MLSQGALTALCALRDVYCEFELVHADIAADSAIHALLAVTGLQITHTASSNRAQLVLTRCIDV